MTIQLIVNGKTVKIWPKVYHFGPFPLSERTMQRKQLELENMILHAKVDVAAMIDKDECQMYAVFRSSARPDLITKEAMADFEFKLTMKRKKRNERVDAGRD